MLNTSIATTKVIEGLSFEIPTGGYCSVVGPSGCGKTTLLLCIAGLVQPAAGKIELV